MKISKALKGFVEKARSGDGYWIEAAKMGFAVSLEQQRKTAGLSYKAVAEKLGTSAAYVSKVFRGDSNVTIESMVKLARVTGGRLDVKVVDAKTDAFSWKFDESRQALDKRPGQQFSIAKQSATIIDFPAAKNEDYFEHRWVA